MAKYRSVGELKNTKMDDMVRVAFLIPKDEYAYLREEAYKNNTSIAEIIRSSLSDHIGKLMKAYGNLNSPEGKSTKLSD